MGVILSPSCGQHPNPIRCQQRLEDSAKISGLLRQADIRARVPTALDHRRFSAHADRCCLAEKAVLPSLVEDQLIEGSIDALLHRPSELCVVGLTIDGCAQSSVALTMVSEGTAVTTSLREMTLH
jgi:hypothetical protein